MPVWKSSESAGGPGGWGVVLGFGLQDARVEEFRKPGQRLGLLGMPRWERSVGRAVACAICASLFSLRYRISTSSLKNPLQSQLGSKTIESSFAHFNPVYARRG